LLEAFPSQEDIDTLYKSDCEATAFFHTLITKDDSGSDYEASDFVNELAKIPDPSTHPVLVAKRMLILASLLQCFPPRQVAGLKEQAPIVMKRLMDTAIKFVTSNEELVGCLEGLECIILEAIFQCNAGNLRRSWLAFRRAMIAAQLMKLDRQNPPQIKILDPMNRMHQGFIWFRIVYMDRFLSLMLGLSQGSPNTNFDMEIPGETPSCKLERVHARIAGRIIERNKRDPLDIATTQKIDAELIHVAESMPDKFWLTPDLGHMQRNTKEVFWEQMRLADQVHHYHLLHLLHLPHLLRVDQGSYHKYSKLACVNASREILIRFVPFRRYSTNTTCCRIADFLALMAGMTLLIVHMGSHRKCPENLLAHQRVGDRALVEQTLDNMEQVSLHTGDILTRKSSDLLRSLLKVEQEVVRGEVHNANTALSSLEEEYSVLQLPIPYFGIIKIGREGIISRDFSTLQTSRPLARNDIPDSVHAANHVFSSGLGPIPHQNSIANHLHSTLDKQQMQTQEDAQLVMAVNDNSDRLLQALNPDLTADITDWAFQGVDATFFDSLMRGV
jgi:hypothetical protein